MAMTIQELKDKRDKIKAEVRKLLKIVDKLNYVIDLMEADESALKADVEKDISDLTSVSK